MQIFIPFSVMNPNVVATDFDVLLIVCNTFELKINFLKKWGAMATKKQSGGGLPAYEGVNWVWYFGVSC